MSDVMQRAQAVWNALTTHYGDRFQDIHGETPGADWVAQIQTMTNVECMHGVTELAKRSKDSPCDLDGFVAACRDGDITARTEKPPHYQAGKPRSTPEIRDAFLARIRARLAPQKGAGQ